jgi:tRNA (guanine-N7-)-methyltransferase
MRMRKKKHADERLMRCSEYLYNHEGEPLSDPAREVFDAPDSPVYLEIGAGKGGFAVGMVEKNPDAVYFAMERVTDCVVLAVERAKETEASDRLRFVIDTADNLTRIFECGTVDRIFLNFSDPWSKKGYAKRRLTHRRYLAVYLNLLKDGGKLCFKTDNVGLFDFSLEEISAMNLPLEKCTRDLHASEYNEGNIMTEYETAFSKEGIKINMLEVVKPKGYTVEIDKSFAKLQTKHYKNDIKE